MKQEVEIIQTTSLEDITKETEKSSKKEFEYCLRCHRKLKKEENRLRGMGKICWEKSHLEQSKRLF